MNSMRFIQMAIDYRGPPPDRDCRSDGKEVVDQETRLYDPDKNETRSMRSKEEAHDYRYFPDPDLLPLEIEQAWVDEIKASLPELPDQKKARFISDFGLSDYDASVLTADVSNAGYFEAVARRPRRQAGGKLGHQRTFRPIEERRSPTLPKTALFQPANWAEP